ncbi:MAG: polymerase [Rhodospirillales bacterium]|nr:polymerase [Rhodospirillales bacterium]
MPEHHYATPQGAALIDWSDADMSASCPSAPMSREPASVGSLVFDLGRKLSETIRDRRALSVRGSSETNSVQSQTGDALDRSLMARIVERDRAAFALIAERHATIALGLAQRIVRNTADAEDVVQESLTRLWVFADRWNPEAARFSSWFYRIVTNQAISRLRRKTTESLDGIEEPSDVTPGPHALLAGREIGTAIDRAMSRLPDRQRAAIALCYDQGLSCAEAAEAMNVSVGTMESLLFRARRSLREWLAPIAAELEER